MRRRYRRQRYQRNYFWDKNKRTIMVASAVAVLGIGVGVSVPFIINSTHSPKHDLVNTSQVLVKENYDKTYTYSEVLKILNVSTNISLRSTQYVSRANLSKFVNLINFPSDAVFTFEDAIHNADNKKINISFGSNKYIDSSGELFNGYKRFSFDIEYTPSEKMTSTSFNDNQTGYDRLAAQEALINGSQDGIVPISNLEEFVEIKNAPIGVTYKLISCIEKENQTTRNSTTTEAIVLANKFINDNGDTVNGELKLKFDIKTIPAISKETKISKNLNIVNTKTISETQQFLTSGSKDLSRVNLTNLSDFIIIDNLPSNSEVSLINYESIGGNEVQFRLKLSQYMNDKGELISNFESDLYTLPIYEKNTTYKERALSEKDKQFNIRQVRSYLTNGDNSDKVDYFKLVKYVDFTDADPSANYKLENLSVSNGNVENGFIKIALRVSFDKKFVNSESINASEEVDLTIDGIEIKETKLESTTKLEWNGSSYDLEEALLVGSPNKSKMIVDKENKTFNKFFALSGDLEETIVSISRPKETINGSDRKIEIDFIITNCIFEDGTIGNLEPKTFTFTNEVMFDTDERAFIKGFSPSYSGSKENVVIPLKGNYGSYIKGISKNAFKDEKEIKTITIEQDNHYFGTIESGAFSNLVNLREDVIIPWSVSTMGAGVFSGTTFVNGKLVEVDSQFDVNSKEWREGYNGEYRVTGRQDNTIIKYRDPYTQLTNEGLVAELTDGQGIGARVNVDKFSKYVSINAMGLPPGETILTLTNNSYDSSKNLSTLSIAPKYYYNHNGNFIDNSNLAFNWNVEIENINVAESSLLMDSNTGLITGFNGKWLETDASREFKGTGILEIPAEINGIKVRGFAETVKNKALFVDAQHFLKEIKFAPDLNITDIPAYTFYQSSLRKIDLTKIETIGESAFQQSDINQVVLGENIKEIAEKSFMYCFSLRSFDSKNLEVVGARAFNNSPIQSFDFTNIKRIGNSSFYGTELSEIVIHSDIEWIDQSAFGSIQKLQKLSLPYDFNPRQHSQYWSDGVDTSKIITREQIIIEDANFTISQGDGKLLTVKNNVSGKLVIPNMVNGEKVKAIDGESFFSNRPNITELQIEAQSMTKIKSTTFFESKVGAPKISKITAPHITRIEEDGFAKMKDLVTVELPNLIAAGKRSFYDCWALKTVTAPKLESIDNDAFLDSTSLASFDFSKIKSIGDEAFMGTRLVNVVLPDSLTEIGSSVFKGCFQLKSVSVPAHLNPAISPNWWQGINTTEVTITVR
ncbi:MAG: leucine-rich repeat domain-containing protein [Mycoplasma sp.]